MDRSGAGRLVEVYPAASLKIWNLPWRDYKKPASTQTRTAIVEQIQTRAPWLNLDGHADQCLRSDHALDALVAALTALACAQGQATQPQPQELAAANTEGWIALPTAPLRALHATAPAA